MHVASLYSSKAGNSRNLVRTYTLAVAWALSLGDEGGLETLLLTDGKVAGAFETWNVSGHRKTASHTKMVQNNRETNEHSVNEKNQEEFKDLSYMVPLLYWFASG